MDRVKELGRALKLTLRQRNITQKDLAKMMGKSEPTLKRWLRGEGLLLTDWLKMLEVLQLDLTELSEMTKNAHQSSFEYTIQQEKIFVETPGLLAFFDQLLLGKTPQQISKSYQLSGKSFISYLSKLEKMDLIEWLPRNKIKLRVQGSPRWIAGGPLRQKFRKQMLTAFISKYEQQEELKLNVYHLSKKSTQACAEIIAEAQEQIRRLELKDKFKKEKKELTAIILGQGHLEIPILTQIHSD